MLSGSRVSCHHAQPQLNPASKAEGWRCQQGPGLRHCSPGETRYLACANTMFNNLHQPAHQEASFPVQTAAWWLYHNTHLALNLQQTCMCSIGSLPAGHWQTLMLQAWCSYLSWHLLDRTAGRLCAASLSPVQQSSQAFNHLWLTVFFKKAAKSPMASASTMLTILLPVNAG